MRNVDIGIEIFKGLNVTLYICFRKIEADVQFMYLCMNDLDSASVCQDIKDSQYCADALESGWSDCTMDDMSKYFARTCNLCGKV